MLLRPLQLAGIPDHFDNFRGDLLDSVSGCAAREFISKRCRISHHLALSDVVPDGKQDLLAINGPCDQPIELVFGPPFPKEVARENNDAESAAREPPIDLAPEAVAEILVRAGASPSYLAVEQENLEDYFLRLTSQPVSSCLSK